MSYPGLTDTDDEETRTAAMSPLSAAASRPAPSFASSLPLAYQPYANMLAANNAELERDVYAPQRKRLDDYTKELASRRAGPSSAERLYEIGAALAAPSKQPGFGGIIADVAPVMAAQRKARREAEDAQRDLVAKYGIEMGTLGAEQAKGRLTSQQALMKSIMAAQIKAGKRAPPMRGLLDTVGNAHHPSLGYQLPTIGNGPGQVPIGAVQDMLSANNPAMDALFDRKYNAPGYSKLLRDYQDSGNSAPGALVDESEE